MGSERAETDPIPTADAVPRDEAVPTGEAGSAAGTTAGKPTTNPSAEAVGPASNRASDLEFHIAVDIVYNRARAGWLLFWHRAFLFGTIVAGSVAAGDVSKPKLCAVVAAVLAALDLVYDPGATAAGHRELVRELHAVLTRLLKERFSAAEMDRAEGDLMDLSAKEGAPYCVQREMAHNQVVTALGRDPAHRVKIGWRRCLAQVLRFEGW